ncbi:unnamed protein product [Absidia cylindrospora]
MASRFTRLTAVAPQLTRGYAAAAAPKAPVALFGLDGRYATALYTAAARQNALDAVEKDLKAFNAAVSKDKAVGFSWKTPPSLSRKRRKASAPCWPSLARPTA